MSSLTVLYVCVKKAKDTKAINKNYQWKKSKIQLLTVHAATFVQSPRKGLRKVKKG